MLLLFTTFFSTTSEKIILATALNFLKFMMFKTNQKSWLAINDILLLLIFSTVFFITMKTLGQLRSCSLLRHCKSLFEFKVKRN